MATLAIVGAGPVGIFAALAAEARGFAVTIFEAEQPGAALLRWGPTRFFSPFRMNVPWWARAHLPHVPPDDALLTGPEFVATVLQPLCAGLDVRRARVVAIARDRLLRDEYPGNPVRGERPFSLLVRGDEGEALHGADRVLDCSGVALPCGIGPGGLPAPGEVALGDRILRTLGALDRALPQLAGQRVLVVGAGHTAARAIEQLAPVAEVIWCVRRANQQPIVEVCDDPLPERRARVAAANALAQTVKIERRATIVSVKQLDHRLVVELASGTAHTVDAIVAATGARPDHALTAALPLAIDPPTEGAARLMRALGGVTDCLTVPKLAPGDLDSGEPGFSLGGQKSYGRARTFLLQSGYQQMEQILDGWRS